ncbi:hypothetical protein [Leptodesmis sp.]|uniref:hypothetical protein n=1 Tax=Leptodesmis sp. TaxID=3100501 RepID=UPI0040534FAE
MATYLFLHCLGFSILIGAALYDRCYIVRNIRQARGSVLEQQLIQILSTSPLYGVGVALVLLSGIGLSILDGSGFFRWSAVGLKQYLFLAIGLSFPVYIIPLMAKINRLLKTPSDFSTGVSESCYILLGRLYFALDGVMIGTF